MQVSAMPAMMIAPESVAEQPANSPNRQEPPVSTQRRLMHHQFKKRLGPSQFARQNQFSDDEMDKDSKKSVSKRPMPLNAPLDSAANEAKGEVAVDARPTV